MCGIIGYIGNKNVTDVLIKGLKALEYRGYDSSGIAVLNKDVEVFKAVGKVVNLEEKIKENKDSFKLGIAHTRWATHGGVTEDNCHPHKSGDITLVHNGIIENYSELREDLIKKGYDFKSETDTEVAAALIDSLVKEHSLLKGIEEAKKLMRGSFALLIIYKNEEKLYCVRKNSPLIVGVSAEENFVASDISAILPYTNKYMEITESDIFEITKDKIVVYENLKEIKKEVLQENMTVESAQKNGYDYFMLKEINEQKELGKKIALKYFPNGEFSDEIIDLSKYEYIDIVACGSAYYAGAVGKYFLDKYGKNLIINIDVASEYRYKTHHFRKNTLVVVMSQSGETADTIAAMRMAHENGVDTLAIVNNTLSTISKECKYVIPMIAGPEIAVATSKGYFTQVIIFNLLILKYMESTGIKSKDEVKEIINEIANLENRLNKLINDIDYKNIAKELIEKDHIYFIGRGIDYIVSLEGSLKLKEISYIHSDVYQAGELKHGSIALIDKETPIVALITDEMLAEKTVSNIIEAKARGALVYTFKTDNINTPINMSDHEIIYKNAPELINPLISIVPMQLLSYCVALLKGCDIDKPKNLAKSVTVE